MSLLDVQRSVLELCFAQEPSAAALDALGDHKVWLLYRDMVRERLRREVSVALPRTCRLLGRQSIDALFSAYLSGEPPRTRFFREVVLSFAGSSVPRLRADASVSPCAADLMTYEAAIWEVRDLDAGVDRPVAEFSFDRPLLLSPALRVLALDHAVHEKADARGAYRRASTWLCLHRASDTAAPRVWPLDAATFGVLTAYHPRSDLALTTVLDRVSQAQGFVLDAAFVDGFCTSLTRFIEAGLVLGSA